MLGLLGKEAMFHGDYGFFLRFWIGAKVLKNMERKNVLIAFKLHKGFIIKLITYVKYDKHIFRYVLCIACCY